MKRIDIINRGRRSVGTGSAGPKQIFAHHTNGGLYF